MTARAWIKFIIPGKPPAKSNNYRIIRIGRFSKLMPTKEVVDYEAQVAIIAKNVGYVLQMEPIYPDPIPVEMTIIWHRSNKRRADLDNIAKAINDGLTKGCVWEDDRQVVSMHMEMLFEKIPEDFVEVYVGVSRRDT